MRPRLLLVCSFLLIPNITALAQTGPTRDPKAVVLLQASVATLSNGDTIRDATLTGTATRTAGSDI